MDMFEIDETKKMRREEAATRLHALADALARNNVVEFEKEGRRITVRVPDEVNLKVEVELGDENELEIELTWWRDASSRWARRTASADNEVVDHAHHPGELPQQLRGAGRRDDPALGARLASEQRELTHRRDVAEREARGVHLDGPRAVQLAVVQGVTELLEGTDVRLALEEYRGRRSVGHDHDVQTLVVLVVVVSVER